MKKINLYLAIVSLWILSTINVNGQGLTACVDPCTVSSSDMFYYPLAVPDIPCDGISPLYLIINYHKYNCPNRPVVIVIENYVIVDDRNQDPTWIVQTLPWDCIAKYKKCASSKCTNPTTGAQFNVPLTESENKQLLNMAIGALMKEIGISSATTDIEIVFPGSCFSSITLQYPDQLCFYTLPPNDLGPVTPIVLRPKSTVNWTIPCNDVCCKTRFKMKITYLGNNQTEYEYIPVEYVNRDQTFADCWNQPKPSFDNASSKPPVKMYVNGNFVDAPAQVISQSSCVVACGVAPQPPLYKTSSIKEQANIKLMVSPTYIKNSFFIENNNINKVKIYDIKGTLVMDVSNIENGELNLSHLSEGIYLVQVLFDNNQSSTIKVYKQ
ncbi:MAG: T9SS type A sorting domain-containing protein [Bacteroidota bacterium]